MAATRTLAWRLKPSTAAHRRPAMVASKAFADPRRRSRAPASVRWPPLPHRGAGKIRERGLGTGKRGAIVVASRVQYARDPSIDLFGHRRDVLVGRRRHRMNSAAPFGAISYTPSITSV